MYVFATPHPDLPDLPFLVDTGAQVTMMPLSWYNSIPPERRPPLTNSQLRIVAANKTTFAVSGMAEFRLRIKGTAFPCNIYISPDEDAGILGMDFMQEYHVILNPTDAMMTINNRQIRILNYHGQKLNCAVTAAQTLILQPGERYVVPGRIKRPELEECALVVEATKSLTYRTGVVAARVIARARNQCLPMELNNGTDEVQKIHKGAVIGVAYSPFAMQPWVDPTEDTVRKEKLPNSGESRQKISDTVFVKRVAAELPVQHDVSDVNIPEHVKGLYNKHKNDMSDDDKRLYKGLLIEYGDVFAKSKTDLGRATDIKHHIDTGDERPFKHKPRRLPMGKFEAMQEQVKALHEIGVIRPSTSNWGSNVLLVKKKDGSWRMCVDYRELNAKTKNIDPYMLPRIDDTLESLGGAKYFCTLDLISGYHQVELTEASKPKTAFLTPRMNPSQWEYNTMPFGINGGPSTFQRVIDRVLRGLEYKIAMAYLDDIIVYGKDYKACCERLAMVFDRLREACLKLKPSKCELFKEKTIFLGHVISAEGISCDPAKVEAVRQWTTPKSARQVQVFLGTVNYYNRFIRNYSEIARPLFSAANRKLKRFTWTPECQAAFETLRTALISAPVMAYPRREGNFILDTDASAFAIGAVLSQRQKDDDGVEHERVIAYSSRTLEGREQRYCTRRRELLAIVHFVKVFKPYLYGQRCLIRTDHASLRYVKTLKEPDDQIARWISKLEETLYTIETRKGKDHANADALSRMPSDKCAGKRCICPEVEHLEQTAPAVVDCHERLSVCTNLPSSVVNMHLVDILHETDDECDVEYEDASTNSDESEGWEVVPDMQNNNGDEMDWEMVTNDLRNDLYGYEPEVSNNVAYIRAHRVCYDYEMEDDESSSSDSEQELSQEQEHAPPESGDDDVDAVDAQLQRAEPVENDNSEEKPSESSPTEEGNQLLFAEKWSADDIAEAQKADPDLGVIYRAKQADAGRPLLSEIGGTSETAKVYLHEWRRLGIDARGIMYRTFESEDGSSSHKQIVLPEKFRAEMCKQFHDAPTAGHVGRRKTVKQLSKRFYWHKMAEDVRWWIKTCEICQKRKCPQAWPKAPLQQFVSGMPNERVAMDIVDHLQISKRGNVCVLTITDHFTKYVKTVALPNQRAVTVAGAFFAEWVAPFGAPHSLHTDQGTNFTSDLIAEICELLNIYKTQTTPYHPAGNGQAERYNRTMMDLIHYEVRNNARNWDNALPIACMAYNSTVHTATGFEPNLLWLGRNVYLPMDRMMPLDPDIHPIPVHQYARQLVEDIRNNFAVARVRLNRAATAMKKYYDRTAHLYEYRVGDVVKLRVFRREKGISKFAERFTGPYYVLDVLSDIRFRIAKDASSKPRVVHHDHILPYMFRETDVQPDKAWVFQKSRTVSPSSAGADLKAAGQTPAAQNVVIIVKDVALDPIKFGNATIDNATQTAYEADVTRTAVAFNTRQRSDQHKELTSTVRAEASEKVE